MASELLLGVSSDGVRVAETDAGAASVEALANEARDRGAELLWVHSDDDLSALGLARAAGYVRLRADRCPAGAPLPLLAREDYPRLLDAAYRALWGHKQVAPDAAPPEGAVVVSLVEQGEPVGLCTVLPAERLIDGPGLVPGRRLPELYATLLLGACARLGPGPVDLDSWGDGPDVIRAYQEAGFAVVDRVGGWELRLR